MCLRSWTENPLYINSKETLLQRFKDFLKTSCDEKHKRKKGNPQICCRKMIQTLRRNIKIKEIRTSKNAATRGGATLTMPEIGAEPGASAAKGSLMREKAIVTAITVGI